MPQQRGIPENIIEEIKQRNEIVSVVEQYVRLEKKSAQNFFGLCPFHSEDTPSFSVSPNKQIYYCFGCHKGGDVIHFIMDIEKVGYLDAVKILAEKAKIEIPASNDHEYQKKVDLQKKIYAANTEAARYFYLNLTGPMGGRAREYLKKRGIDPATVKRFGLGYAIDDWTGLYRHLQSKGYSDEIIFLTGLFKKRMDKTGKETDNTSSGGAVPGNSEGNAYGRGMYDLFRNRLMFPIFDYLCRIVAFGGRVMDDSLPKYINSPETPIYTKGRHLYGFHIAKSSKEKQLIIVEGYMDAISMHQAGVTNAVASLGTALTEQQALLARKHSENVIIAYDSDAAGQAATLRGMEILAKKGCKVSVLRVPDGKDPDEFIRKNGAERFLALTKEAMPFIDYKLWNAYNSSFENGTFSRITYQNLACNVLAQEENKIIRELYASTIAEKLGLTVDPVLNEIERRIQMKTKEPAVAAAYSAPLPAVPEETEEEFHDMAKATKEELYFLCLISSDPRIYSMIQPEPKVEFFSDGLMQMIAGSAFALAKENKLSSSSLVEIGGENVVNHRKLSELFANGCMKIGDVSVIREAVAEAQRLYIKMQIKKYMDEKEETAKKIMQKSGDEAEQERNKKVLLILANKINLLRNQAEPGKN